MGSSRDWAAKGTALLGVKAVLAESFERIHRSNLIGMGVLPLQSTEKLNLTGEELFSLHGLEGALKPRQEVELEIEHRGHKKRIRVMTCLDTPIEVEYYLHGGILPYVLRHLLVQGK
jgi:aconitate hydratase